MNNELSLLVLFNIIETMFLISGLYLSFSEFLSKSIGNGRVGY